MPAKKGPGKLLGLSFQGDGAALFRLIAERLDTGEVKLELLGWKLTENRLSVSMEIDMKGGDIADI